MIHNHKWSLIQCIGFFQETTIKKDRLLMVITYQIQQCFYYNIQINYISINIPHGHQSILIHKIVGQLINIQILKDRISYNSTITTTKNLNSCKPNQYDKWFSLMVISLALGNNVILILKINFMDLLVQSLNVFKYYVVIINQQYKLPIDNSCLLAKKPLHQ